MSMNKKAEIAWEEIAKWVIIIIITLVVILFIAAQFRAEGDGIMAGFIESFRNLIGLTRGE